MGVRLAITLLLFLGSTAALARQPIFGSAYFGGETHDVDYKFPTPLPLDPEDDGDTWGVGVGYEISDRWIVQLDYTATDADDVDIDQIILSLNYKYPLSFLKGMSAVGGLVIGEGSLEWNQDPEIADPLFDDLDDDESLYGIQVGLEYQLTEHWSTSLMYQYLDQEFNTNIDTDLGRLEFEHSSPQYLLFGLRYNL